ncbi:hypothetical protein AKO1_004612, partial [Acrasis kona]
MLIKANKCIFVNTLELDSIYSEVDNSTDNYPCERSLKTFFDFEVDEQTKPRQLIDQIPFNF